MQVKINKIESDYLELIDADENIIKLPINYLPKENQVGDTLILRLQKTNNQDDEQDKKDLINTLLRSD
ncbi:MAG: hypothetical protein ACKKL5_03450 [Candidatus Komeilibacteria bacterium]